LDPFRVKEGKGWAARCVSELLLGKRALSPDMALRIARLTNTTAESWLHIEPVAVQG
jgi:plasmid maintenance system antidote protein VapI